MPPAPIPPPIAQWIATPSHPDWAILDKFPEPNVRVPERVSQAQWVIAFLVLAAAAVSLWALYYVKQRL